MTPLPPPLGGGELVAWRLDLWEHRDTWDSGEGAYRYGGRWNSRGVRAVYCSIDPATAILEVAVHQGFRALDIKPYALTAITISSPAAVHGYAGSCAKSQLAAAGHAERRPAGIR